jgi:hypothetical protein
MKRKRLGNEVAEAYFKVLKAYLNVLSEENHDKSQSVWPFFRLMFELRFFVI